MAAGQGAFLLALASCFCLFIGGFACNPDWTENEGKCYLIVEFSFDIRYARRYCQQYGGGDLAYVGSNQTLAFLRTLNNYGNSDFWIKENSTVENSTSEQPNGCPFLSRERIEYGSCGENKAFICEQNEMETEAATLACPRTWHLYGTSCYKPMMDNNTLEKAIDVCTSQLGSIAILDSISKEHHAAAVILGRNKTFLVGAKRLNESSDFEWINHNPFVPSCPQCFVNSTGDCLGFQSSSDHPLLFRWVHLDCSTPGHYLCEMAPSPKPLVTTPPPPSTTTPVPLQCPHGYNWKAHEASGFCFWETTYETERLNWHQARQFCQAYGGDLATYEDASQELEGLGGAKGHYRGLWFGLSRSQDNVFSWVDGSPLIYTNWETDQPDLDNPFDFCVVHGAYNSMWKLDYCGVRRWFICKARKTPNPAIPDTSNLFKKTTCDIPMPVRSGLVWYYYRDHCYLVRMEPNYSWYTAKTFCRDNGAHMLSLHSFQETDFTISLFPSLSLRSFWIGLSALGFDSAYEWTDGSPVDFFYLKNQNESLNSVESCVSMDSVKGFWSPEHCNTFKAVICKRHANSSLDIEKPEPTPELPGNCQKDWNQLGNKCYKVFGALRSQKQNFRDALEDCRKHGSDLASVHSQEEQDFVTDLIITVATEAYLGLHRPLSSMYLAWTDGTPIDFTVWSSDIFSMLSHNTCGVLSNNETEPKWTIDACTNKKAYVCQMSKDPNITVPPPDPFVCPSISGWFALGGMCFGLFEHEELNWVAAQRKCRGFNGNLATIDSSAVGIFLKKKVRLQNRFLWIGVREVRPNQYGALLNGAKLTYSNWLTLQPRSVAPPLENCVTFNQNAQWVVMPCEERHGFICEFGEREDPLVASPLQGGQTPCPGPEWVDLGGESCYIFGLDQLPFSQAWHYCFKRYGNLASFHSREEMSLVEKHWKSTNQFDAALLIGLTERHDGELSWTDHSPVDFTNFRHVKDPFQVVASESTPCTVMNTRTLLWTVVPCDSTTVRPYFLCSVTKRADSSGEDASSSFSTMEEQEDIPSKMTTGAILGMIICVLVIAAVVAVAVYYMCPCKRTRIRLEETDSL